jgi:hypothetical protein
MSPFVQQLGERIQGELSGFDRLVFRGTLRQLAYPLGMMCYLSANHVLLKDFAAHAERTSAALHDASLRAAEQAGREIRYLPSSLIRKEQVARDIAQRDGITTGLICVLRCVEPCLSFEVHRNRAAKLLELHSRQRKCLHLYHYYQHPVFGFMHARIQTWFPFSVQVCLNGREWLAGQMDRAGLSYVRRDNCFTAIEDVAAAQALFDQQLQADWPQLLGQVLGLVHPSHPEILGNCPVDYYWSVHQSEWATDLMFRSRGELQTLYPRLVRHALTSAGSADVMRFLGKRVAAVPKSFAGEVVSDAGFRVEGVRVKHRVNENSVKMYDKGSVLRIETTINEPKGFKVYRPKEGEAEGDKDWRVLRRGVADLARRAEVSQSCNERYQEALAAVSETATLQDLVGQLSARVAEPGVQAGTSRRVRGLNVLGAEDAGLLAAVRRQEHVLCGLRNRDLVRLLYGQRSEDESKRRKQAAAVTRRLRLLRAHGLIHKVPKTHRYQVSPQGRKVFTAVLAARQASTEQLVSLAA